MAQNKSTDISSKVVIIGGKPQTISDVRKSFAELEFTTTIGTTKIVNALRSTKEPLTRAQLTEQTGLSTAYIITILSNLEKFDYVVGFHIGKRKTIYYALTETGYNTLSKEGNAEKIKTES
jgi:DNA-binding transcriptional regulator GbsR (MarR family)